MKTKKKFLVALDLEEQAMIALQYAEYFAEILDYELDVMTVIEESSFVDKLFSDNSMQDKMRESVEEKINTIIEKYKQKVKVNTHIAFGKVYEKIIEYAEANQPSAIFMGKSEMPKYKRAFLGSNSLHVILESDIPVITIRGKYDFDKYKNEHKDIMVPLDLSKSVDEQMSASIEFAKLMKKSLYLYAVEQKGSKGEHTKMLSQLAKIKKTVVDSGVDCRFDLVQDTQNDLHDLINKAAAQAQASLIVIMTRAENKFAELILGSHATNIINNAEIPVVNIEPWDEKKESTVFSKVIDVLGVFNK